MLVTLQDKRCWPAVHTAVVLRWRTCLTTLGLIPATLANDSLISLSQSTSASLLVQITACPSYYWPLANSEAASVPGAQCDFR